jgi:tetratricopeptide (TPR) repeat protein
MYVLKILLNAFFTLGLISCESNESPFFMRYKSNDPEKLEKEIVDQINDLEQTHQEYDVFVKSIDLSENLTVAGRENDAIELLQTYIETEKLKAEAEDLAWLYLNYATANQYARKSTIADEYFKKALVHAEEKSLETVTHYIFQHYGRFLVEQKEYEHAKKYFEKALSIRERLNDHRVVSTQMALDSLNIIMR